MSHPGQHSGSVNESNSALRILTIGFRQSFGADLAQDGYTQVNPPVVTASDTKSTKIPFPAPYGILGGSIAFLRPDLGNGILAGPPSSDPSEGTVRPLGFFLNDANGYRLANQPALASGKAPYVIGTVGLRLYETQVLGGGTQGDDLIYRVGDYGYASRNGYLTNINDANNTLEAAFGYPDTTVLGILRLVPDSEHDEIIIEPPV